MTICLAALVLAGSAVILPAIASADHHEAAAKTQTVALIGTEGQTLGMAILEQTPAGVLISVSASGIGEGEHAFHVHEKGLCDAAGGFTSAGGHFAPDGTAHGYRDAKGHHAGDMPNLFAGADGHVRAQVLNQAVSLPDTGEGALFDADGSALVIHAGPDDYLSQPAGAAGGRIACAVISPPKSQ